MEPYKPNPTTDILLLTLNLQRENLKQREKEKLDTVRIFSMGEWRHFASPDSVAGTTVPPSTLDLLESINAALLPPEAAAWSVDVFDPWFGVYCKV